MNRGLIILLLFCLFGCSKGEKRLKVAATAVPHAEMLTHIKGDLLEKGIDLEILIVEDYQIPNRALNEGEIDANFFQHIPFLLSQVNQFHYPIHTLAKVHIEPMGIYSKKVKQLADLKKQAVISLPNDPSNEARALALLHHRHLITLDIPNNLHATLLNIMENPKKFKFEEIDAAMLPRTLQDVDAALIPTNFALQAQLSPLKDALALEDNSSTYVNVLVVREGDEERPELLALKSAMNSDEMRAFILEKYKGAIIPAF
jgi:D-methionine transport system substrate-binding protein